MRSYDSAGLGGPQADPGSSPHGFAAEETRSLRLLDDPGRGLPAPYRIVPALSPRLLARVPVRLDPGALARARRHAVTRAEGLAGRGYLYQKAETRMPLMLFSARYEPE